MKLIERYKDYILLADQAQRICDASDIDWETKYEIMFVDIGKMLRLMDMYPDYYDPDTTYEEDTRAFVAALQEQADRCRKLVKMMAG